MDASIPADLVRYAEKRKKKVCQKPSSKANINIRLGSYRLHERCQPNRKTPFRTPTDRQQIDALKKQHVVKLRENMLLDLARKVGTKTMTLVLTCTMDCIIFLRSPENKQAMPNVKNRMDAFLSKWNDGFFAKLNDDMKNNIRGLILAFA